MKNRSIPISFFFGLFMLSFLCLTLRADQYSDYVKKGRDHFGLFQWPQAKAMFEKAISLDSNRFDAYFHLGKTLTKLNDIPGSIDALENAHRIKRDDTDTSRALNGMYIFYAKDYRNQGNRPKMMEYLEKACRAYPQNTQNWAKLLEELTSTREWDKICVLGKLLKQSNQEALQHGDDKYLQDSLVYVAKAWKEVGNQSEARVFIQLASRINKINDDLLRLKNELGEEAAQIVSSNFSEGKALFESGNLKAAIKKLEKAADADPGNQEVSDMLEEARKSLAISEFMAASQEALAKKNYSSAVEKAQSALSFSPEDAKLQERVASITEYVEAIQRKLEKERRKRESDERARRTAIADKKKKLDFFLEGAKRDEENDAFNLAQKSYESALEIDPDNEEIQASLERVKKTAEMAKERQIRLNQGLIDAEKDIKDGEFQKAFDRLRVIAKEYKKPVEPLLAKLLECSFELEKLEDVEIYIAELEMVASDSLEFYYYRGATDYKRGDYSSAQNDLGKVYNRNKLFRPDLMKLYWGAWAFNHKGPLFFVVFVIFFFSGKPIFQAFTNFMKSRESGQIETLIQAGNYPKLIPLLEKRHKADGYLSKNCYIALGEGYLRANQLGDAKRIIAEFLSKDPKNPAAQRIFGEACYMLKETSPDAIDRIYNLFKVDPNRKDVLIYLVSHYKSMQADSKTALDLMHKQILVSPDDEETLVYLAEYYGKRSQFHQDSLKVFEKAAILDPDRPLFLFGLAQSYLHVGKSEEATRTMEHGREKWPEHELFRTAQTGQYGSSTGTKIKSESVQPTVKTSANSGSVTTRTTAIPTGESIVCKGCGENNHIREYYCTKCGKPLS